jgi:DNA helicase-4
MDAASISILIGVVVVFMLLRPLRPRRRRGGRITPKSYSRQHAPSCIETASGIRVKSSGERAIADWLYANRIRFRYEEEIKVRNLRGNGTWRSADFYLPDYDVYWEHFGLWQDPEYQRKAKQKIAMYHEAGHRVICTFVRPPSSGEMRRKFEEHCGRLPVHGHHHGTAW